MEIINKVISAKISKHISRLLYSPNHERFSDDIWGTVAWLVSRPIGAQVSDQLDFGTDFWEDYIADNQ